MSLRSWRWCAPPPDDLRPLPVCAVRLPPNALGYCGPADSVELFEVSSAGADREISALATAFDGAFPYLQLIAGTNGIDDPLDSRVVEAYWIGNRLLEGGAPWMGASLDERFRRAPAAIGARSKRRSRPGPCPITPTMYSGSIHGSDYCAKGRVQEPMHVLDRCRIRWGSVVAVDGDRVLISARPLGWDGQRIFLDQPRRVGGLGRERSLSDRQSSTRRHRRGPLGLGVRCAYPDAIEEPPSVEHAHPRPRQRSVAGGHGGREIGTVARQEGDATAPAATSPRRRRGSGPCRRGSGYGSSRRGR